MSLWSRFQKLLPTEPLFVGTITQLGAGGIRTVTLPSGHMLIVRGGDGLLVGARVFVRGGVIQGSAPVLADEELEI